MTAAEVAQLRCPITVTWLDLDSLVARCVLPAGHRGDHRDGTRWWDHAGFQIPRPAPTPADNPKAPVRRRRVVNRARKGNC